MDYYDKLKGWVFDILEVMNVDTSSIQNASCEKICEFAEYEAEKYRNKATITENARKLQRVVEQADRIEISEKDTAFIESLKGDDKGPEYSPIKDEDGEWPIIFTYNEQAY